MSAKKEDVALRQYGLTFAQPGVVNWGNELKALSYDNPGQPLILVYNSTGGNIADATYVREMHFWLMNRNHHLTTYVFGHASSCTAWVVRAANWVMIGEDSEFMIHRVIPTKAKDLDSMEREVTRCHELEQTTFSRFIEDTDISMEEVVAETAGGKEWIIGAHLAVKRGLANGIVPRTKLERISFEDWQAKQPRQNLY
jgi:ATP-dependent protease ClpP protease subunit